MFGITLTLLAVAVWVGTIVFHSFVVAPTVFRSLDEDSARRFLRTLFPRFYKLGLICGLLMLVGILTAGAGSAWPESLAWLLAAALAMVAAQTLSLWLTPRINAARDQGEAGAARFRKLHAASVGLTLFILLLGLACLAALPVIVPGIQTA